MSGHSKWSSIKHKKGAADAKRGKLFSKLARSIIVAAKEGGGDPAEQPRAPERDREGEVVLDAEGQHRPRDREGRREPGRRSAFETIVYEGYGPEGVAVIAEALTDNRNRTASEVRHIFAKFGGNLGTTGAVAWQFERRGVVLVASDGVDEEELFLAAADGGADDLEADGGVFEVTSAPEDLAAVRAAIEEAGFAIESAELSMVPKNTVAVDDEGKAKQLMRLIDALEDNDDVQDVYANFDIPEQVLEAAVS